MAMYRDLRMVERKWRNTPLDRRANEMATLAQESPRQARDIISLLDRSVSNSPISDKTRLALGTLGSVLIELDPALMDPFLKAAVKHRTAQPLIRHLADRAQTAEEVVALLAASERVVEPGSHDEALDVYALMTIARAHPGRMKAILDGICSRWNKDRSLKTPLGMGNLLLMACLWVKTPKIDGTVPHQGSTLDLINGLIERGSNLNFPCVYVDNSTGQESSFDSVLAAACCARNAGHHVQEGIDALISCGADWTGLDEGQTPGAVAIRMHPAWRKAQLLTCMNPLHQQTADSIGHL